jgi:ribose/xylose/arabinose/galactoside ABC-type transport system permease subunit
MGVFAGNVLVYVFFAIVVAGNHCDTFDGTASRKNQVAELGIAAVPVGMLIVARECDLSVASVLEMSGRDGPASCGARIVTGQ